MNKSELCIGALLILVWFHFLSWIALPLAVSSAALWALGGKYGKAWRMWGCAAVASVAVLRFGFIPAIIVYAAVAGACSIGYGIPDQWDKGSALGRFWLSHMHFKYIDTCRLWADILTRATVGLLLGVAFWPLATISVWWWLYGTYVLTIGLPILNRYVRGNTYERDQQ